MQKITPHLWFDSEAEEAASHYASIFKNSRIGKKNYYGKAGFEVHGQPEGKLMTVEFYLEGIRFIGLNGGPIFRFTPAVSFLVACSSKEEVDLIWNKLSEGGSVLMELGKYDFSERYGWLKDRFGLSWQIMLTDQPIKAKIIPALMNVNGRAEEAINFYISVFHDSKVHSVDRYENRKIKYASFKIENQEFATMDSPTPQDFNFNEAVSFMVHCKTQEEIDYYWDKLSADANAEQCGWLKDKYGISWQIVPTILEEMLEDRERMESVTEAFLKMKKLDIEKLKEAYDSEVAAVR